MNDHSDIHIHIWRLSESLLQIVQLFQQEVHKVCMSTHTACVQTNGTADSSTACTHYSFSFMSPIKHLKSYCDVSLCVMHLLTIVPTPASVLKQSFTLLFGQNTIWVTHWRKCSCTRPMLDSGLHFQMLPFWIEKKLFITNTFRQTGLLVDRK